MNFLKKHWRLIGLTTLFISFFFLLGFLNRYYVPRIKKWVLVEIESQSHKHLPVRMWPQSVDINLVPIGATFYEVKILPQSELKNIILPTKIEKLEISLSIWELLKGQIHIGRLHVTGAKFNITVSESITANKNKLPDFSQVLSNIPSKQIILENVDITTNLLADKLSMHADIKYLNLENKYRTLRFDLDSLKLNIIKTDLKKKFDIKIDSQCLVDADGVYFSHLKIEHKEANLVGAGALVGDIFKRRFKNVRASIKGQINLNDLEEILNNFTNHTKTPKILGKMRFETDLDYNFSGSLKSNYMIDIENFKVSQFDIGDFHALGKADEKKILITKASAKHSFGSVSIENAQISFDEKFSIKGNLAAESIELSQLLNSLNVKNVPVYTHINGKIPCSGRIKNKFNIKCEGQLNAHDLSVVINKNQKKSFNIVSFNGFSANGEVVIDDKAVTYKTKLQLGKSQGESSGVINYEEGFKIKYSTPLLYFTDLTNLASLKPEGSIAIQGQTSGNAHIATVAASVKTNNFLLEDYKLGNGQFDIRYQDKVIFFDKIQTQIGNSQINGDIQINIPNSTIKISSASPYLEVADLITAFSRKVTIPPSITGTGSAKLNASGPLQFNKLSYTLNSSLFRGTIADESYDQLQFNVVSHSGLVEAKRVELSKGRSKAKLTGNIKPNGIMNITVSGNQFQIEQSENIAQLKTNLTGNIDFTMLLEGHIQKPNIKLAGQFSHVLMGDVPAKNSDFNLKVNEEGIKGSGQFFGNTITANFNRSSDINGSTYLNFSTQSWNFAQTFSIFSESLRNESFQTKLTSSIEFNIPNKDPTDFSASLNIKDFIIQNNRTKMSAPHELNIIARNGIIDAKNFEIIGDNTYVRIKSSSQDSKKLGLTLEGKVDLSLASLFTPFLDDISGTLSFFLEFTGTYLKPILNGSSFVENSLLKFKGFPHPLEQVKIDSLFSDKKIIINSVKGKIGGGPFNASGNIFVNGVSDIAIDINGGFQDAKLSVPDGFNTKGRGDFFVRGSWFPYTLGVNYNIDSGLIERKSTDTAKSPREIKPSTYLPKFLSAQRFSPIILALGINFHNPIPVKILISRADIRADVSGQMKIAGPPEAPLLTGKINIAKGGKITFRNNTFEIKSGTIDYTNAPAENPNLNVEADARVTAQIKGGETTRDYDVNLKVQGSAQKPKISMSSQPPLPENELISLLTLGFINEDTPDTQVSAGDKISTTSYQLWSAILDEQLGINRALESHLGMRFNINSTYDASDKAEKHTISLKKQWTPKFGTSASRSIGKTNSNNMRAEYKLNKNLSVVGQWEGKEPSGTDQTTTNSKDLNTFGLDVEYKVEFR
ncbi:MAG: hypothetical protein A2Z20_07790 [Bdellovibrionales bacterium RBG_16_40_8]|nr:MAG: hypothetical protein A2Z20_07790 [Bdellovibrionales bacterium RBG_16_40_8]